MGFLDVFALLVLLTLAVAIVAAWVGLGMMPGRIAKQRNHPQADAINICGWWGVITMGLLLPLAFVWAYYDPDWRKRQEASANKPGGSSERGTDE